MVLGYLKSADKFISFTTLLKSARHRENKHSRWKKKQTIIFTSNRHILFTGHWSCTVNEHACIWDERQYQKKSVKCGGGGGGGGLVSRWPKATSYEIRDLLSCSGRFLINFVFPFSSCMFVQVFVEPPRHVITQWLIYRIVINAPSLAECKIGSKQDFRAGVARSNPELGQFLAEDCHCMDSFLNPDHLISFLDEGHDSGKQTVAWQRYFAKQW